MNNRISKIIGAVGFVSTFFTLIACGDSKTTETVVEKGATDIVASVADLPKCTAQNEGEQIFVKEDGQIRFCSDGKWYAVAGGESSSCSTEALKDSSGIKIVCNGDSVGVVLNGAKGDRGEQGIQGEAGADGKDGSVAAGCTVETLADDSGLKVICGGDSVGVVLNGKDGEQGEKGEPGKDGADGKDGVAGEGSTSSCALVTKDCIVHVACDKDTVSLDIISKEDACNEITILDSEQVAISLDSVKGASQKGPFLSGSKVLVKELLDGRTLSQTGNNFDGKILNDKGEFKITARMLVSQYVMLEATGYYRNEVTGENSNSPLTLFGITDVTTRNIVNINLLTHLEYERVIYLVTKKKMKVLDAKKQAQQEIFDILHIDNSNFSNSEDLSIAGSSDEDGALLAFSILFQGDRSVSQLTELLTRVSTAMEKEGKWEDATTKAEIADWAMAADTSYRLDSIRKYVADWKLGSMVPKFEPYIRNFWRVEHGLGSCGDTVKVGTVVKPTQGKAKADVRFICAETDDGDIRWRIATDFEKDTYDWKDSTDGALKNGAVTDKKYVYDATGAKNGTKGWREAAGPENQYGGCNESLYDSIRTYRGKTEAGFYQCQEKSHQWVRVRNSLTVDTQLWKPDEDGYAKWGDSVGVISQVGSDITWKRVCYVYDTSAAYRGYRVGNDLDCNLGLEGCTKGVEKLGVMQFVEKNNEYYMCKDNKWNLVDDEVQKNTYMLTCNADNDGSVIPGTAGTWYYVCDANQWREASQSEYESCSRNGLCSACTQSTEGTFTFVEKSGTVYACDSKTWIATKISEENSKVKCAADNIGMVMYNADTLNTWNGGVNVIDWICSETGWHRGDWWNFTIDSWKAHFERVQPKLDSFVDSRDGRWYKMTSIGSQVWMAENLKFADSLTYQNLKGQSWCYDHVVDNCEKGGRYYSWTAAMNLNKTYLYAVAKVMIDPVHRGICPEGWHMPTSVEWLTMNSVSGGYKAQQMTGNVKWLSATNSSGFSAIPSGYLIPTGYFIKYYGRAEKGQFKEVGNKAFFWSATEGNATFVDDWELMADGEKLYDVYYETYSNKDIAYNVRCVRDNPATEDD